MEHACHGLFRCLDLDLDDDAHASEQSMTEAGCSLYIDDGQHHDGEAPPPEAQRHALRAPQRRPEHHQDGQGLHHQGRHRVHPPAARRDFPPRVRQHTTPSAHGGQLLRRPRRLADQEDENVPVAGRFHGSSSAAAATSPPVDALEVRLSGAGDKVLVVSVACRHRRDAVAKVCLALDGLRLHVIAANVTSASGTVTHTALVQRELHQSEMKELIEIAIAQLDDVMGISPLSTMSY